MKKHIKYIIEALFDDPDIFDNEYEEEDISLEIDRINHDAINKLIDKMESKSPRKDFALPIRELFSNYDSWTVLSRDSYKSIYGIKVNYMYCGIWNNIEYVKLFLDLLQAHNVRILFLLFNLLLENISSTVYSLKDIIDWEKYKNVVYIECLNISHGEIEDLDGILSCNVLGELALTAIKGLKTLKGFPDVKDRNIGIYFDESTFPKDWSYLPNHILMLELTLHSVDLKIYPALDDAEKYEELMSYITSFIGPLTNIPQDLTCSLSDDILGRSCYRGYGVSIINNRWPALLKKDVRQYISDCLKAQYKKSGSLKTLLCKTKLSFPE